MALETIVFQQDPFTYKLHPWPNPLPRTNPNDIDQPDHIEYYSPSLVPGSNSNDYGEFSANICSPSSENGSGVVGDAGLIRPAAAVTGRRKRRRARTAVKNKDDVESQRMTHIAVERNRRRQMNDYLAVLRSMMPPSYVQRGDQASIIGGAINYVKELEQLHLSLKANRLQQSATSSMIFSDFFTFPQFTTACPGPDGVAAAAVADVEVTVVDGHANIKVRSRRQPAQFLKMVVGLHSLRLLVLHLTLAAAGPAVLFSFTVKVEESCQLNSANEIAAAVYEIVCRIQGEQLSCV